MRKKGVILACMLGIGQVTMQGMAQDRKGSSSLRDFPAGSTPQEVGQRVAERFLATPHANFGRKTPPKTINYPESCTWYGALIFARASHNKALQKQLVRRFEPFFGKEASLLPKPDHVDHTVFGIVPLELYRLTKQRKYLELGLRYPDGQWGPPQGSHVNATSLEFYRQGFTWQTRLWIDDMYMVTAVETQAYRATGDKKYIDRAAKEMVMYLDSLQRPNGLFYHAPDVPFYWGRGNGWVAAGMTEILRALPANDAYRPRIMAGYKKMMAALLTEQAPDGLWRQLIMDPDAWTETSGSGMFAFAMITGVKEGWLDERHYGPAARKAWLGLVGHLNADADMTDVCEGTNKKNDKQYYLDRKRNTGDLHGQAPMLWCAAALLMP